LFLAMTAVVYGVVVCMIVENEDGKAKSIRHSFDMGTLLQELGLAKAAWSGHTGGLRPTLSNG
jgi:hypothetical protein